MQNRLEMTSRQAKQQEDTYFRMMRILEKQPDLTQRQLAEKMGISVSGINYCLKALIQKGWVKANNFANSKNKLGYAYILTPSGLKEKTSLTSKFLKRKINEYEELKMEVESLKNELFENRK